jgi:hypothetical protein
MFQNSLPGGASVAERWMNASLFEEMMGKSSSW